MKSKKQVAKKTTKKAAKKTTKRYSIPPRQPDKKEPSRPIKATIVRNSAVPKAPLKPRAIVTHDMIAQRAYEIHLSGSGGSEQDNWLRAERELRGSDGSRR